MVCYYDIKIYIGFFHKVFIKYLPTKISDYLTILLTTVSASWLLFRFTFMTEGLHLYSTYFIDSSFLMYIYNLLDFRPLICPSIFSNKAFYS